MSEWERRSAISFTKFDFRNTFSCVSQESHSTDLVTCVIDDTRKKWTGCKKLIFFDTATVFRVSVSRFLSGRDVKCTSMWTSSSLIFCCYCSINDWISTFWKCFWVWKGAIKIIKALFPLFYCMENFWHVAQKTTNSIFLLLLLLRNIFFIYFFY